MFETVNILFQNRTRYRHGFGLPTKIPPWFREIPLLSGSRPRHRRGFGLPTEIRPRYRRIRNHFAKYFSETFSQLHITTSTLGISSPLFEWHNPSAIACVTYAPDPGRVLNKSEKINKKKGELKKSGKSENMKRKKNESEKMK